MKKTINLLLGLCIALSMLSSCSGEKEGVNHFEKAMKDVFTYELNQVEPEHEERIHDWLDRARREGKEGQFHIQGAGQPEDKYTYQYIYKKGSDDYEVNLVYNPDDSNYKATIHVTGLKNTEDSRDGFVQIKMLNNQLSSLIMVSDEPLNLENKSDHE